MQKEFLLSLGLTSVFSCFLFCFVFFILDDDETRAMLAALLVKKFKVHLLFACFTVRSVGARITKVYLLAVIMKAQWLCGMLSLDQRPGLFRYPLHSFAYLRQKRLSPLPPPPPSIINITNSVDNTKLSRYINDFHLRTIVLKEEKETEITHVLVNLKNNWSVSPIISLLHAVTSWPFVFVRRNMKRDVGAWISITLIQNF